MSHTLLVNLDDMCGVCHLSFGPTLNKVDQLYLLIEDVRVGHTNT